MKSIEDKFEKNLDEVLDYIRSSDIGFRLGKLQIDIPKKIVYQTLRVIRYWEADDIADIKNNYGSISETCMSVAREPENTKLLKESIFASIKKANFTNYELQNVLNLFLKIQMEQDEATRDLGWSDSMMNPNQTSVNDVYLGDFREVGTENIKKYDFIVRDRFRNSIPAVVVCSNKLLEAEDNLEASIASAMSYQDYSKPFDIDFQALPLYCANLTEKIQDSAMHKEKNIYRGPKIIVRRIIKNNGDTEKCNPVNVFDLMPQFS